MSFAIGGRQVLAVTVGGDGGCAEGGARPPLATSTTAHRPAKRSLASSGRSRTRFLRASSRTRSSAAKRFRRSLLHVNRAQWEEHVGSPKSGNACTVKLTVQLMAALKAHRHLKGPACSTATTARLPTETRYRGGSDARSGARGWR